MVAVSVVIPLYNKADSIGRALRSVLGQTMKSFEVVVVDDGSSDHGPAVVHDMADARIKLLGQKNAGVSAARNVGIQAAKADIVAFLDADDEWQPDFLATICSLRAAYSRCAVYATSYAIRRGACSRAARLRGLPDGFKRGELENYFAVAARSDPPLCASSVAVAKKAVSAVGGFPTGTHSGEDLVTWARLAARYRIAYSTECLATFWAPQDAYARPGRVPGKPDLVAAELDCLLRERRIAGVPEYLAMWHRMRGATFLQLGNAREARRELAKAVRLRPLSAAAAVLLTISLLPGTAARQAYASLRRIGQS